MLFRLHRNFQDFELGANSSVERNMNPPLYRTAGRDRIVGSKNRFCLRHPAFAITFARLVRTPALARPVVDDSLAEHGFFALGISFST